MKILNITSRQSTGGVLQVFYDYTKALTGEGNEVAAVVTATESLKYPDPIQYDRLDIAKKIYRLKHLNPILDVLKLVQIILNFKPDVLITHTPKMAKLARYAAMITRTPIVAVNHGEGYKCSVKCDYIFNVNEKIRQFTINAGKNPDETFYIPNMIEIGENEEFKPKKFRKPIIIGALGRFERRKGFKLIVEAVRILRERGVDCQARIAGGPMPNSTHFDEVKELINKYNLEKDVLLVGIINDKEKLYAETDIICSAALKEDFGLVMIEAFRYSTPLVSTDTEGTKIIVEDRKDALVALPFNVQDIADKLQILIEDEDFAHQLARNGFEKVKEQYSMYKIGKLINDKLQEIIDKK